MNCVMSCAWRWRDEQRNKDSTWPSFLNELPIKPSFFLPLQHQQSFTTFPGLKFLPYELMPINNESSTENQCRLAKIVAQFQITSLTAMFNVRWPSTIKSSWNPIELNAIKWYFTVKRIKFQFAYLDHSIGSFTKMSDFYGVCYTIFDVIKPS